MINFITINISTLSIWWRDTKYVTQFYFWKETDCTIFLLTQGRNSWENISDMVKMLGQCLNKCTCSIQCIIFYKLMLSIIPQFMKFKYIHPFITGDDSQKNKNTLLTFQNLFLQNHRVFFNQIGTKCSWVNFVYRVLKAIALLTEKLR